MWKIKTRLLLTPAASPQALKPPPLLLTPAASPQALKPPLFSGISATVLLVLKNVFLIFFYKFNLY